MKKISSYILPICGGIIGGLVASIPWILAYVFLNFIVAILAAPIAAGVSYGYQKLGGKPDQYLPTITTVISLLVVAFVALVAIPMFIILGEGYQVSFYNLSVLYQDSEFIRALFIDAAISLIFAFVGIRGVIFKTKQAAGLIDEDVNYTNPMQAGYEAAIATVKEEFAKHQAFDSDSIVTKEKLTEFLADKKNKAAFNQARIQTIVRKKKGGYYFSEKAETSYMYRFFSLFGKIMLWVGIFVLLGILIAII